jgi:hypothetical protein
MRHSSCCAFAPAFNTSAGTAIRHTWVVAAANSEYWLRLTGCYTLFGCLQDYRFITCPSPAQGTRALGPQKPPAAE